jgi:hypothetical protein
MRSKLEDHIGAYVLCKGWVGGWEDMLDRSTRRVYIMQPTIKEGNPELLYENQIVVSTEHHLNLFIRYEDLKDYECTFDLHSTIHFAGFIQQYTRKSGTIDYGVYPAKQSTLHFKLERLVRSIQDTIAQSVGEIDLNYLESALKQVLLLQQELEECGDHLPTFQRTRDDFLLVLGALSYGVPKSIRETRAILASRSYRRSQRPKKTCLEEASGLKDYQKTSHQKKTELIMRLGNL